jgi:hypothetical protein
MPTTGSSARWQAQVGIHDYGAARKKGVDGGPEPAPGRLTRGPAMTGWAWSVQRVMQLLLGVAYVFLVDAPANHFTRDMLAQSDHCLRPSRSVPGVQARMIILRL